MNGRDGAEDTTTFIVQPADAGKRIDILLPVLMPRLSRSAAANLIAQGKVLINRRSCRSSARPVAGARIDVRVPASVALSALSQHIELDIIYEDEWLVVVNKPAGMVVHPAPGHNSGTLVNALLGRYASLPGDPERPGIVHRLDKDTSGLIVVARTAQSIAGLAAAFKRRDVCKEYVALVVGAMSPQNGSVVADIGRDPRHRQRMAVVATGGRDARTHYKTLERLSPYSLLSITLETGRMHQIRVHLSTVGHPIVGDTVYGRVARGLRLDRQFLHAARLRFEHPVTGADLELEAPLPDDLAGVLSLLRASFPAKKA